MMFGIGNRIEHEMELIGKNEIIEVQKNEIKKLEVERDHARDMIADLRFFMGKKNLLDGIKVSVVSRLGVSDCYLESEAMLRAWLLRCEKERELKQLAKDVKRGQELLRKEKK